MTAWRPALRLARRDLTSHPWRSVLVVLLVALPVAGVTTAAIVVRTVDATPERQRSALFGTADFAVRSPEGEGHDLSRGDTVPRGPVADLLAPVHESFDDIDRIAVVTYGPDALVSATGRLVAVTVTDVDLADPLVSGLGEIRRGRAPRTPTEIAVRGALLDRAGAEIGDSVTLYRHGARTVVGELVSTEGRGDVLVSGSILPHPGNSLMAFVDVPGGLERASDGVDSGAFHPLTFDPATPQARQAEQIARVNAIGGAALVVAAIVASAAFATGAGRQLRSIGLLVASGAGPTTVRAVTLLQGVTVGVVGSVAGAVAGGATAVLLRDRIVALSDVPHPALTARASDIALAIGFGTLASLVASARPARTAAAIPVLAALAGRRPLEPVPLAVPVRGLAVTGACLLVLAGWRIDTANWPIGLALAGGALVGCASIAPWLVERLGTAASHLGGSRRLAARALARNRLRSGAVVAGITAPLALAAFASTVVATIATDQPSGLRADQVVVETFGPDSRASDADIVDRVVDIIGATAPGPVRADVESVRIDVDGGYADDLVAHLPDAEDRVGVSGRVVVATPELIDALALPPQVGEAIDDGRAVVLSAHPGALRATPATDDRAIERDLAAADRVAVPYIERTNLPLVLAPREMVDSWKDATPSAAFSLLRSRRPLTSEQRDAIDAVAVGVDVDRSIRAVLDSRSEEVHEFTSVVFHEPARDVRPIQAVVVGGGLAASLAVVAMFLGLSAAESRDETLLLAAIGASPATRRAVAAWQAAALPALAAVLGLPLGVLAVAAALNRPIEIPWVVLGLLALAIPAASGVATRVLGARSSDAPLADLAA